MTIRQLCNVVYARLVDGADSEARDKFDADLNAPAEGWAAVESRFFTLLEGGEAG